MELAELARPLDPEVPPYYRQRPGGPEEPAAGWYMVPRDLGVPIYIGFSFADAYINLKLRLGELARTDA